MQRKGQISNEKHNLFSWSLYLYPRKMNKSYKRTVLSGPLRWPAMKWAVFLLSQLWRGTTSWQRPRWVSEATPPPVMSTYQRKVTVLGLDTEDEPLQLPLFLDKGGKSKMKMQVANEHSSTYCLLTTFSLTYEPTLLKRTQSYWSTSNGQRSSSALSSPLSLQCGIQNSPSVADEIQRSSDSPFYRLLTLLCLSDTLNSVNERKWLSFLSTHSPSSV